MSTEHMDDVARRGAKRLRSTVADLVDDGQDLLRGKLLEAADILQYTRDQAAENAREAMDRARDKAQASFGDLERWAGKRPLATAAAAVGIGVILGLALHRSSKASVESKAAPAAKPARARKPAAATAPVKH